MSDLHPSLLPNGLKDLLAPEAENEASIINNCMAVFESFGYQRIKPPLAEFEECLLAPGPGQSLSAKTFRMMDPVSGRMMGIRADTTAQIARIAGSRLGAEHRPLRLSYAVDVLRVKASQLRPDRQFCQVGCELIGSSSIKDDAEIALIALKALSHAEIKNLSIDLTIPSLADIIFDDHKLDAQARDALNVLLQKRDRDGLAEHKKSKAAQILVMLLDASGCADDALKTLANIKLPKLAKEQVQRLTAVYAELTQALVAYDLMDMNITFDLIERRGFEYQKGVSFTIFSKDVRGELGRGGRYDIQYQDADKSESATGFTLYMDGMMQAYRGQQAREYQVVDHDTQWKQIRELQKRGEKVIRGKE